MKSLMTFAAGLTVLATPVLAGTIVSIPEVGTTGSIAALAAVAAVGVVAWERRRRNRK